MVIIDKTPTNIAVKRNNAFNLSDFMINLKPCLISFIDSKIVLFSFFYSSISSNLQAKITANIDIKLDRTSGMYGFTTNKYPVNIDEIALKT